MMRQRRQIGGEVQRDRVDRLLDDRRRDGGHGSAVTKTVRMPGCFDAQMANDDGDGIGFRDWSPVALLFRDIEQRILQAFPRLHVQLINGADGFVQGTTLRNKWQVDVLTSNWTA